MKYLRTIKNIIKRVLGRKTPIEILVLRGLTVGVNLNMQRGCIIDESHCWHIEIGNNVTMAPNVHILAHDASTKMHIGYTKVKNVKIGNNVFIGAGTIVLPGAIIGSNVVIGAGSIVAGVVNEGSLYAGSPARFIMPLNKYIESQKNLMNDENVFGEEYTLRNNVSLLKKEEMKQKVEKHNVGFVV